MGLGAVLLLLLLLDSSCAEPIKRQKVTDPNYMHHVMNGGDAAASSYRHGDATVSSYKHGYSSKAPLKLTAKTNFTVESCTVKFPGISSDNKNAAVTENKPSSVAFWWEFGCTTGTTTVKEVGSCFGQGTTDKGVTYSETYSDAAKDNRATVTFTCKLDPAKAEMCNSKLRCLDDVQKLMITGQGRLDFVFTPKTTSGTTTTDSSFAIVNPVVTMMDNEDQPHLAVTAVPMTRFTQGFAALDVTGCFNGNAKATTGGLETTTLPQSTTPAGANSKFRLILSP